MQQNIQEGEITEAVLSSINLKPTKMDNFMHFNRADSDIFDKWDKIPNSAISSKATKEKFIKAYKKKIDIAEPLTITDAALEMILKSKFPLRQNISQDLDFHKKIMVAENLVGELLEAYIESEIWNSDWIWCAGHIVTSVDFVRINGSSPIFLQVKNRNNSENSSSSQVRVGTDIKKWHRLNSHTGETYWPDLSTLMEVCLSEQGFHTFIRGYFS